MKDKEKQSAYMKGWEEYQVNSTELTQEILHYVKKELTHGIETFADCQGLSFYLFTTLGYRKITDSVVLSKEEYNDYINLKELLDKGYFTSENRVAIHKASKETAEKIFNEFYAELKEFGQGRVITYASVCEIAKKHNITIPRETFTSIEIKE